jgi:hypothetical protein
MANSITLQLQQITLINVDDAAGRTQYEGGTILKDAANVGQYVVTRRVTEGGTSDPLNTAQTSITLFLNGAPDIAPENITIDGAHDFSSGQFKGGVAAASNRYNWIIGADATYVTGTGATATVQNLTIDWTGTKPETSTGTVSTAETVLPDGHIKAVGYIAEVWEQDGRRYLSIDYAEWLTGEEAIDAAAAAGYPIEPGEDEYWIRNENPQKRTFEVSGSVAITTSTRWVAGDQMGAPCTWADFESFWGLGPFPESEDSLHEKPWWIERNGSLVVKIDEQYLP